jgi:hypothetical protein
MLCNLLHSKGNRGRRRQAAVGEGNADADSIRHDRDVAPSQPAGYKRIAAEWTPLRARLVRQIVDS